jgi:branched-chain amino acid transport system ATP-binding protein
VIEIAPHEIVAVVGHDGAPARFAKPFIGPGYVPPGRRVFGSLTVEENLAVGAYGRAKDFSRVYARFPRLQERRSQRAGTLSGGEQQLLVIARALMGEPDLLVLEDPSAGLAPAAIDAVAEAIEGLRVLIADEHLALAARAADRIVLVEHDAVVFDRPVAEGLAAITDSWWTA